MLLNTVAYLPQFPKDEPLVVDVETTSFDKEEKAFKPFNGHRIAGVAIGTVDGKQQWYLPLRHHSGVEKNENINLEVGLRWFKDVMESGRDIINHNIKFDGRFWHQDGITVKGELKDTMVLARLVHNRLPAYNLDYLSKAFCGIDSGKDNTVKAYCKSIKSKDYGDAPASMMGKYAERDVKITADLYNALSRKLPDISKEIWEIEYKLTKHLLESEIIGVPLDIQRLKTSYRDALRDLLMVHEQINEIAGEETDPMSNTYLSKLLTGKFGIKPKAFTKTGKAQWNKMAFETLDHPIGKPLARYKDIDHFISAYCKGWITRVGEDGRLHADFWQSGTKTSRLSCHDPNLQNVPLEAEIHVRVDEETYGLVMADYSQMEYRIFGHYTKDEAILGEYNKNPYMDFHGHLAGMLGVDRQFAKQLNFSFIYGMGKKKLIANLAGLIALKAGDDKEMAERMRTYLTGAGTATAQRAKQLDLSETTQLAEKVYADYHRKFPSIRQFQTKVNDAVKRRGWVKNWFGRRYVFEPGSPVHQAVNYLIQGSAADCFKTRLVSLFREVIPNYPGVSLLTQVHDSVIFMVPKEMMVDFAIDMQKCLEDTPMFRVPMLADIKVANEYWSQGFEIEARPELVGEKQFRTAIQEGIEKSKSQTVRGW